MIRKVSKGFTLMEIIVVLAILGFVISIGLLVSLDFYKTYAYKSERNILVGVLEKARSRSMANINQSAHGVYIDTTNHNYIIFQGQTYATRNSSYDQVFPINPSINLIGVPSLPAAVVFSRLSGTTTSETLTMSDGTGRTGTVDIGTDGQINW